MQKKIFIFSLIFLSLCFFVGKAQQENAYFKPDYARLEIAVKADPDEYNKLLDRFMACDTTLTIQDLHFIYYGFPFAGNYNPMYSFSDLEASLKEPDPVKADSLCREALKDCSVSLRALTYPYILHSKSSDEEMAKLKDLDIWRLDAIASVILTSGESDEENPLYTIFISDEYALLEMLGLPKPHRQFSLGEEPVDVLVINHPQTQDEDFNLYFNIQPSRLFLIKMFHGLSSPPTSGD